MKSNDIIFKLINSRNNHLAKIPRMDIFDGLGSLYNLPGIYYPITPVQKNVLRAVESISSLTKIWENVYSDLGKSINMFATLNELPQSISKNTKLPYQININGSERTQK